MSTPLDDFKAYLEQYDTTGYSFALGRWTETTTLRIRAIFALKTIRCKKGLYYPCALLVCKC